ncbi:type 1 glutamine amidotransferase [Chitinimonas sp.]|uniref:type 1 glutamine amidotransferase n=1 Tax=Chitinimonas sp. TaxID=1934313 RepID=UPI002F9274B2
MPDIAIIEHCANDDPAYLGTWLEAEGLSYRVYRMYAGETLPADLAAYRGLAVLGGPMSANDALPYYPQLFGLIREAVDAAKPVIGHCLGGQLLSRALGGTVQASEQVEIGWSDLAVEGVGAEWFGGADRLRPFQWHGESFSIPPGAARIATGPYCANQAFVLDGRHLGMQFHCEVDETKVRRWLIAGHDELIRSASPAVQQAEAILPTLAETLVQSQATAAAIYRRWAQGLG